MDIDEEIRPGANRYVSEEGATANLPTLLTGFSHPIIITGEKSYAAYQAHTTKPLHLPVYRYDGSASDADAARIAAEAKHADMIIAIGGGRLLDTAKLVAEIFDCEYITVPTLASNCAPYTPIGAIYNAVGHTFNRVAYFPRAPYATVVDWDIIATTPEDYLVAGIGDTLAKWYEMEGITRPRRDSLTAFSQMGFSAAQTIRTILQRTAVPAVVALRKGQVTADLVAIADTIIGIAGTVGGFAGADGRMAGAHAIHNGLSYVDETHEILHGSKVAYGILVQLAYTGDDDEIRALLPFYQQVGLPTNLSDLHVVRDLKVKKALVADWAAADTESFRLIDPDISSEKVLAAMDKVEALTAAPLVDEG